MGESPVRRLLVRICGVRKVFVWVGKARNLEKKSRGRGANKIPFVIEREWRGEGRGGCRSHVPI